MSLSLSFMSEDDEVSDLIRVKVLVLLYLSIYVCLCLCLQCQRKMMLVTWSVSRSSSSFFITSGVGTLSSSSSLSVSISCVDKEVFSETKGMYYQFSDEEHEVCWWWFWRYVGHLQLDWRRRRWRRTGRGRRCWRTWWGAAHTSWGRGIIFIIIVFKHTNISLTNGNRFFQVHHCLSWLPFSTYLYLDFQLLSRRWRLNTGGSEMFKLLFQAGMNVLNQSFCRICMSSEQRRVRGQKLTHGSGKCTKKKTTFSQKFF